MTLKSVTSFISDLQTRGGPSSTNQFDLEFAVGDKLAKFMKEEYQIENTSYNNLMVDLINEAQVPGVSLTSQDVKQVHKGITMKPAMAKVYNEMDFSCILDVRSEAFRFFTAWQHFIQGADVGIPTKLSGKKEARALAQHFYNDYTCDTTIKKYEKYTGQFDDPDDSNYVPESNYHTFTIQLRKSYPYMMSSIPYSSGGSGVVKLSIGMYYEYSEYTPRPVGDDKRVFVVGTDIFDPINTNMDIA